MQKRAFERIPADIKIKFHCNEMDYDGTVTSISENGMFICTSDVCFPFDYEFKIVLPVNAEVLNLRVKVSRITRSDNRYDGIGVEILKPSPQYLKFVGGLKSNS